MKLRLQIILLKLNRNHIIFPEGKNSNHIKIN